MRNRRMTDNNSQLLRLVCPTISSSLDGPLHEIAIGVLQGALNQSDRNIKTLAAALHEAPAEKIVELNTLDKLFGLHVGSAQVFQEIDKPTFRGISGDVTTTFLATIVVLGFVLTCTLALRDELRLDSVVAGTIFGYLSSASTQVLSYYFGDSKSRLKRHAQPPKRVREESRNNSDQSTGDINVNNSQISRPD